MFNIFFKSLDSHKIKFTVLTCHFGDKLEHVSSSITVHNTWLPHVLRTSLEKEVLFIKAVSNKVPHTGVLTPSTYGNTMQHTPDTDTQ